MKEATGELSMTVITLIAIILIAGIVMALRTPIKNYVSKTWCVIQGGSESDCESKYNANNELNLGGVTG